MSKHLHILGICGTFMGGVAILARQLGFKVTGSDEQVYPPMSTTLESSGIEIMQGYKAQHLQPKPDMVLVGNVCSRGNEAVEYMLNEKIPFNSGPAWLEENLLNKRHVLAVSGTHGKTTTTSMLAWILTYAGLKPGFLIGGLANNFHCTAELGQSPYFVIEADEYDSAFFDKKPKFLHYFPNTLVINNIEFDHGDIYENLAAIKKEFHQLIRTVPGNGLVLFPENDGVVQEVLKQGVWSQQQEFIGSSAPLQFRLNNAEGSDFEVFARGKSCGRVKWSMVGQHNVENAMAAIASAEHVGVAVTTALEALSSFAGVARRLELKGEVRGISIYDDFAHHPSAISKTLQALRAKVGKKPIIAVVQFASNTMRQCGHDIVTVAAALNHADRIVILNSRLEENYISDLRTHLNANFTACGTVGEIIATLKQGLQAEDQVLIMTNKSFDGLQEKLLQALTM